MENLQNTQYTLTQRRIHWWVAALVAAQYLGQDAMRCAMGRVDVAQTPTLSDFIITTSHTLVGLCVLGLTIWGARLRKPIRAPNSLPKTLARIWHLSLRLLLVLMVITGVLSYYTEISLATRAHELGKWVLGMLVIGHMLAGLVHWLVFKDHVLQGMLGKSGDADTIKSPGQSSD